MTLPWILSSASARSNWILRTGELRKGSVRINLPDQPFQILKTLLDRPGDLVTREELRHRLWPAETFVDFEHGLNAAVRGCAMRSGTRPMCRGSSRRCLDGATDSSLLLCRSRPPRSCAVPLGGRVQGGSIPDGGRTGPVTHARLAFWIAAMTLEAASFGPRAIGPGLSDINPPRQVADSCSRCSRSRT